MSRTISERVDDHTHVPVDKLTLRPPFPDAIKIELTARCNYRCSFCANQREKRDVGDIDKDFLFALLRQAKQIGVREIGMFLLGESFLVRDLPEYIEYAKKKVGIEYVFLTTNGSLCTPERMVPVIDAGLDSIKFSVNAGSRQRYLELHGVDLFDQVVENIAWVGRYRGERHIDRPRTCVSSIYVEDHKDELQAFRKMISEHVDEFYFLPLYNQAGHVGGKEFTRIVGNPGRLENMVPPVPCWALFNAAKVTWDGKLTACCFDHDTRFEIADLHKVSLMDAWHHPKFIELRARHLAHDLETSLCAKCLGLGAGEPA